MSRKFQVLGAIAVLACLCPIGAAFGQDDGAGAPALHGPAGNAQGPHDEDADSMGARIVAGAKSQIGNRYDASYFQIPYPNGDVPAHTGLCADVVVRALRSVGFDLQQLIHEDRVRNFRLYPRTWGWGRNGPDANSDHRVVPNQMFFFGRFGLPLTREVSADTLDQWQPGDLVYWNTGSPLLHAGIISDSVNGAGCPLVIHMSGDFCAEDDRLLDWPIIGHFRFPARLDANGQPNQPNQDGNPE